MSSSSTIRCPACHGPLLPTALHCGPCDLTVTGRFVTNEFASLAEEDLHFLRIFILCEGRIRDMESALGVSYPTIKARLAQLKTSLAAASPAPTPHQSPIPTAPLPASGAVLKDLEAGRLTFDQAMARIKQLQQEGPSHES